MESVPPRNPHEPVLNLPPIQPRPIRNPSFGMFLGILSIVLGSAFTLLQMNHFEVDWRVSTCIYAVLGILLIWSYLAHAVPHCGKAIKIFGTLAILIGMGLVASFSVRREFEFQHTPPPTVQTDTNMLSAINGVSDNYHSLVTVLSTNQSDPRLAALALQQRDVVEEGNELQKTHELFQPDADDLKTLRAERDNELAQKTNAQRQAEIQQSIDAIQNKQKADEDARQDAINTQARQQRDNQTIFNAEKIVSAQTLPLFDYTIRKLVAMLQKISDESGDKVFSDFPGDSPNVYASNLASNGIIVNGTNSINIGTNSAWNFKISMATLAPLVGAQNVNFVRFQEPFARMSIVCQTTNGESVLIIGPYKDFSPKWHDRPFVPDGNSFRVPNPKWNRPIRQFYTQIVINLLVPNGLNQEETISVTNSQAEIDKALRGLIEAQDQQCPLIITPNSVTKQP